MKNEKLYKIIVAAMMAALACVATMIIRIPSPMQGYVNLGDAVVLMCGWILGPIYGVAAAGIGSMLADILAAYPHYAPGTLVIKAVVALIAYVLFTALRRGKEQNTKNLILPLVISGIAGEIAMVVLYFVYASLLLGKGWAAAASIPGNLMQGAVCADKQEQGAAASVQGIIPLYTKRSRYRLLFSMLYQDFAR